MLLQFNSFFLKKNYFDEILQFNCFLFLFLLNTTIQSLDI